MKNILLSVTLYFLLTTAFAQKSLRLIRKDFSRIAAEGHKTRDFSWKDLFIIKRLSDIQLSPDGSHLLYVRTLTDSVTENRKATIWILNVDNGEQHQWSEGPADNPKWSPDGQQIAYTASGSHGIPQLFIGTIERPKSPSNLFPENVENISWSPDGKTIAFSKFIPEPLPTLGMQLRGPAGAQWAKPAKIITGKHMIIDGAGELRSGHTHLFIVSAAGGIARQLTSGPYNDIAPFSWTPDSKQLLFCSSRSESRELVIYDESLYQVNVDNGNIRQLTTFPYGVREPSISPDGQTIAFVGCRKRQKDYEQGELFLMKTDGSGLRSLASSLDREITQPCWTPDGRSLVVVYSDKGLTKMSKIGLDGKVVVLADNLDGDEAFSIANSGLIAFPQGNAGKPVEAAIYDLKGKVHQLTRLNDSLFKQINVAYVKPLNVRLKSDAKIVGSWLTLPPHYDPSRRYPLILSMHGGPHGNDGPRWSPEAQLFAGAGYAVLTVNYRGSTSYGFAFADQTYDNFPGPAYNDLMSAVDAAIATGIADPSKLFVTGGSAGGELTAWIVGKTNRFKAAAAVKPVIDLFSHSLMSDQYVANLHHTFSKTPWEDPLLYWHHSPISLADRVVTPTLLLVGEDDRRTVPGEAMEFYNALQIRGIPTALALVPGASHQSLNSSPSQLANDTFIILDWFGRYGGIPRP